MMVKFDCTSGRQRDGSWTVYLEISSIASEMRADEVAVWLHGLIANDAPRFFELEEKNDPAPPTAH